MKVLIVEDEIMAQKSLARILTQNFPDIEIIGYSTSIKNTVDWLKAGNTADIIFMDVELSDGECFEIFRQAEVKSKVIMTTSYDSYAIKAFEAGSIDYLLKPINPDSLKRAVSRCRIGGGNIDVEVLLKAVEGNSAHKKEYKERYIVKLHDKIIPIQTSNIAYIFSEEKTNYLVTFDNQKHIIDSSLDIIHEELNPQQFFKISRGCIINLKAIVSIIKHQSHRLTIISNPKPYFEMTVSRSRVDDFLEWLEK